MTSKTAVAIVPPPSRDVTVDRTVVGGPTNLTDAIGALMGSLKSSLVDMRPDDVSVEIDAHSDASRSSARVRLRAYRHRNGTTN